MSCKVNKKIVEWTLDSKFIEKIKKALKNDRDEIAGILLFGDNCKSGTCNKQLTKHKIFKGEGSSVYTPNGIINFHTHPNSCYEAEDAVFGWPSGEDMAQVMRFAKSGNLIHIVFSREGAYVIKVNKILKREDIRILEKIFKITHVYRSRDQSKQKKDFSRKFFIRGGTTLDMWLRIVNGLTLSKLYKLNGKPEKSSDNTKIFDVKLINMGKTLTFKANFIDEMCHAKSFGKSHE
jgi:hypothetical protein